MNLFRCLRVYGCFLILSSTLLPSSWAWGSFVRSQDTEFLTFEELSSLSEKPAPSGPLREKLNRFWVTPIINNEPFYRGVKPLQPINEKIGKSLILATWNIEKSIHMDRVIHVLVSDSSFQNMLDPEKSSPNSKYRDLVERQRKKLLHADVITLQEIEIGMKRSDYMDAAKELANALDMNYAFAPQYLEIDPVVLGTEHLSMEDGTIDQEAEDYYRVDAARFKGVFGSAVLSRYPIKNVQIIPLKYQPYDWYHGEKNKTGFLEHARRGGTKTIFKNEITRELKVGGRIFFRVDLEVPELPNKTLTIINIHLEIKCLPEARAKQIEEILSYIRDIENPVVLSGDFNSAPHDLSATSVTRVAKRTAENPTTWFSLAMNYVTPHALAVNVTRGVSNVTKNFQDPTAKHVPVIAPNKAGTLFEHIESFRFYDGHVFDFRGDKNRSVGRKKGTLANSNQRDLKGFKTTFQVVRPIGIIGKYRLDWIFVKSFLSSYPKDKDGSYRFAPHFGETLEEFNTALREPLSDHHPSVVYLPFEEPELS